MLNLELELKYEVIKIQQSVKESKKIDKYDLRVLQESRTRKIMDRLKTKNNADDLFIDGEVRLENLKSYKTDLEKLGKSIERKNMAKLTQNRAKEEISDELWHIGMEIKTLEISTMKF